MNVNDSIFDSIPDLRLKVFNAVKSLMKEQDFYINGVSQHGDGESGHLFACNCTGSEFIHKSHGWLEIRDYSDPVELHLQTAG